MKPHSRLIRGLLAVIALVILNNAYSQSNEFPNRPIKIIVGFAAGGGTDSVARILGKSLGEILGQPIVIDNKPGANGMIANELVSKAPADGYTLLMGAAGPLTISPNFYEKVSFDTLNDYQAIALVGVSPFILTVNSNLNVNSVLELTALAKAQPGKLNYASSGTGGSTHMAGELYKKQAGIVMTHVPYKGLQPAVVDLLSGQVQLVFADPGVVLPLIADKKLKALAMSGSRRSSALPSLPTMAEAGLPDYRAETWYGLVAPAGTDAPIVARLNTAVRTALAIPETKKQFDTIGIDLVPSTSEQFSILIKQDFRKWSLLIKEAGLKLSN